MLRMTDPVVQNEELQVLVGSADPDQLRAALSALLIQCVREDDSAALTKEDGLATLFTVEVYNLLRQGLREGT